VSDETRIAVDLFDAKSHTPIWHGSVSQSVGDLTGRNAEAKIGAGTSCDFCQISDRRCGTPGRRADEDLIA